MAETQRSRRHQPEKPESEVDRNKRDSSKVADERRPIRFAASRDVKTYCCALDEPQFCGQCNLWGTEAVYIADCFFCRVFA